MSCEFVRRLSAASAVAILSLAACSNWQRVGGPAGPTPGQQLIQAFDPAAMFTGLGRLVSAEGVNYTGSVAYLPGGGDSTQAIIGLSVSNHALGFQKDGGAYAAKYRLEYTFARPGHPPVQVTRDETARVATFQETMRIDESLLLQQVVALAPGTYTLTVRLTDLWNTVTGLSRITTTVPAFPAGSVSAPILVYHVSPRAARSDSLHLVLNPRGTVAYGGDTLLIYLEGVGYHTPTDVPMMIRDDRDSVIFHQTIHFTGQHEIEGFVVYLAPEKAPLGKLEMVTGTDTLNHISNAVVSFSQSWVVTNFADLLDMLKYFGQDTKISEMRKAKAEARSALWRDFNKATDPNPATPENEALEQYFARLAYANYKFRDEGVSGWRTDRGEAFIILGEPDEIIDRSMESTLRYYVWTYNTYSVQLVFQDLSGFTRFRLVPESRVALDILKLQVLHSR